MQRRSDVRPKSSVPVLPPIDSPLAIVCFHNGPIGFHKVFAAERSNVAFAAILLLGPRWRSSG
jgi:hypothetical protein